MTVLTGARQRAERAARGPPTGEPDPASTGVGREVAAPSQSEHHDVAVVGGGVIGLAVAWRAAQRGLRTLVLDADEDGAWRYAAGMLAPVTEAEFGEDALLGLGLRGLDGFPAFCAELGVELRRERHARRRARPRRGRGARAPVRAPPRARPRRRAPAPEPGAPRRARARADGPARARRPGRRRRRPAGASSPRWPKPSSVRAARSARERVDATSPRFPPTRSWSPPAPGAAGSARCRSARSRARSCACATPRARTSSRARSAPARATSSRAARAATCSARRSRSAAGTPRRRAAPRSS